MFAPFARTRLSVSTWKGEHLDLINTYANYDDESDEWQIRYIALSGNNIAQTRRLAEDENDAPTTASRISRLLGSADTAATVDETDLGQVSSAATAAAHLEDESVRREKRPNDRPNPYLRL